jgi:hypothetical protein
VGFTGNPVPTGYLCYCFYSGVKLPLMTVFKNPREIIRELGAMGAFKLEQYFVYAQVSSQM